MYGMSSWGSYLISYKVLIIDLSFSDNAHIPLVETSSEDGYTETVYYKPSESVKTKQSAWEDALELKDKKGEIRLCYYCGKSALGGRWLISCEHCPLHWHLGCLSPPLASPPPRTRKWMCPNHAYHVQVCSTKELRENEAVGRM
jgi:hypothetical protein